MKHIRWAILALLFLASVINYIDRQSLSILARTIQDDLQISDIGYSFLVQVFLFAYMLSFLVAGFIRSAGGTREHDAVHRLVVDGQHADGARNLLPRAGRDALPARDGRVGVVRRGTEGGLADV